jgi:glycosyltransferase involved in cell wall biosynthesis
LADVLLKLARDPELCARNGAQNRERIREHYDSLRMCKEMANVLDSIQ